MAHTLTKAAPPHIFQRVYVWELPVRFYHWINAACIVVLAATGFVIGNPPSLNASTEAYAGYWFGTCRFIHFATAYVFVWNFAFRIYWGFVGNKYANWKNFLPHQLAQMKEVAAVLKADILQIRPRPVHATGHNAVAYFTYFVMFLVFLFQVITGFALYAPMSHSWFPQLFTWVTPIFGSDLGLRYYHHLATWFFIIFTLIHIYLVFYHDYVEGRGVMSSMVGGWKFVSEDDHSDKSA
jgi:Ni/Fe-hydrogenase 1 B-type cytochrome subunit